MREGTRRDVSVGDRGILEENQKALTARLVLG